MNIKSEPHSYIVSLNQVSKQSSESRVSKVTIFIESLSNIYEHRYSKFYMQNNICINNKFDTLLHIKMLTYMKYYER